MTKNAVMWSMRACRELTVSEMAKLLGQDLRKADLQFTTESQMRDMLGMGMHVATAGFALAGLLLHACPFLAYHAFDFLS